MIELKDAKAFVASGYEVRPAVNGGFLVMAGRMESRFGSDIATFSDSADLLAWLKEGHRRYDDETPVKGGTS